VAKIILESPTFHCASAKSSKVQSDYQTIQACEVLEDQPQPLILQVQQSPRPECLKQSSAQESATFQVYYVHTESGVDAA